MAPTRPNGTSRVRIGQSASYHYTSAEVSPAPPRRRSFSSISAEHRVLGALSSRIEKPTPAAAIPNKSVRISPAQRAILAGLRQWSYDEFRSAADWARGEAVARLPLGRAEILRKCVRGFIKSLYMAARNIRNNLKKRCLNDHGLAQILKRWDFLRIYNFTPTPGPTDNIAEDIVRVWIAESRIKANCVRGIERILSQGADHKGGAIWERLEDSEESHDADNEGTTEQDDLEAVMGKLGLGQDKELTMESMENAVDGMVTEGTALRAADVNVQMMEIPEMIL